MPRFKSKNKLEQKAAVTNAVIGGILFVVTGFVPLFVRLAVIDTPPELAMLLNTKPYTDFFSYWRAFILIICAAAGSFYLLSDIVTGGLNTDSRKADGLKNVLRYPPVWFVTVYMVFVLLSAVFSPFRYTTLHGTYDRCESVFVQIAYVTLFLITLYYVREDKHVKIVLAGLLCSTLLMGAVGIGQLAGYDFIATPVAAWLLTGQNEQLIEPVFTMAYGLLFNPNTYGLYTAMLAPLMLIVGCTYCGHKAVNALLLTAGLLMLAGVVGSRSLGGFLGVGAACAVALITGIAYMVAHRKYPAVRVCVRTTLLVAGAATVVLLVPPIRRNCVNLWRRAVAAAVFEKETLPKDYLFDNGALTVTNAGGTLMRLMVDEPNDWLTVLDKNGQTVPPTDIAEYTEDETAYTVYTYDVQGYQPIAISRYASYFIFEGIYLVINKGVIVPVWRTGYEIVTSEPVLSVGFEGYERWATARGYIWSRSLPLVAKYWFLGSGPDSFVNVFPQNELGMKQWVYANPYMLVDKAHNLYIQTGITTGGVSMVALIALLGYYIISTFLSLIHSRKETAAAFGLRLGLLAAVSAFAVSSMATDSTVPTTGVLYVLLGVGYALNARYKRNTATDSATASKTTADSGKSR